MPASSSQPGRFKLSLRMLLSVQVVSLILLSCLLVGYISHKSSRNAVTALAFDMQSNTAAGIIEHVQRYLEMPHRLNHSNAGSLGTELLDVTDQDALAAHFRLQMQAFNMTTSSYFGNTQGGLVNAGREGPGGAMYEIVTENFRHGVFNKYRIDTQGNRSELLNSIPNFDARTRPWFTQAVTAQGPVWTDVYMLFTEQALAIAASQPVYDSAGKLLGVVAGDLFLTHLSDYLQRVSFSPNGQSFILERSGFLIATSSAENLLKAIPLNAATQRLHVRESTSANIRQVAMHLEQAFGGYGNITQTSHLRVKMDGQHHFLYVSPLQDDYGIDWLVAMVVPENDFMGAVHSGYRTTLFLMIIASICSGLIALLTARWITGPLVQLTGHAQKMAQQQWQDPLPAGGLKEIDSLAHAFNVMRQRLKQAMDGLTDEIDMRHQIEKALRDSEHRYHTLFDAAFDALLLLEIKNGRILEANEGAKQLFGYSHLKLLSLSIFELSAEPDKTREALQNPQSRIIPLRYYRRADGSVFPVEISMRVFHFEDRLVSLASLRDISERLETEKQTAHLQSQLQHAQKMEAVGTLAGGIAHDFNNLLQAISGYTQLLAMNPATDQASARSLSQIQEAVNRAAQLVRQMLTFSRKMESRRIALDLNREIQTVCGMLERTLARTIVIETQLDPDLPPILADAVQIEQIIMNLAVNSADAMPQGGTLKIVTHLKKVNSANHGDYPEVVPGDYVQLVLTDTGYGIAADILDQIFDPFFTTKGVGKGTGLGLASVYGIVKGYGGTIRCYSQIGQGTRFEIFLPVADPDHASQASPKVVRMPAGGHETILIADDEAAIREMASAFLGRAGYQVITATNGHEALATYQKHRSAIDMVMLDLGMPEMDGRACLKALRQMHPGVKVLIASGYLLGKDDQHLLETYRAAFIAKPYQLAKLQQKVREVLDSVI